MKISNDTLNIMSSFTNLNTQIQVKPGSNLVTVSGTNSVLANAKVEETFDTEFCIYDLSQFLGAVSMFDAPEFEFGDKSVKVSNGNGSYFNYVYADPRTITVPPKDRLELDGDKVTFTLTNDKMKSLQKASAVLGLPNLVIRNHDSDGIEISVEDVKNPTSNKFAGGTIDSDRISEVVSVDFQFVFKFDNIKILNLDYNVEIYPDKKVAHFQSTNDVVEYWIALEHNDTFYNQG